MQNKINNKVLANYSMVALPIGAMAMPIAIYLPPLYSGSLGLSLADNQKTKCGKVVTLGGNGVIREHPRKGWFKPFNLDDLALEQRCFGN